MGVPKLGNETGGVLPTMEFFPLNPVFGSEGVPKQISNSKSWLLLKAILKQISFPKINGLLRLWFIFTEEVFS